MGGPSVAVALRAPLQRAQLTDLGLLLRRLGTVWDEEPESDLGEIASRRFQLGDGATSSGQRPLPQPLP